MLIFKKVFNFKLMQVVMTGLFLFNSTAYGMDLSNKGQLRKQLDFNNNKSAPSRYFQALGGKPGKFRTFKEYIVSSLGKEMEEIQDPTLCVMWALYLSELDMTFAEAGDFREAYSMFYDAHARHLSEGKIDPKSVKAYVPLIRKPFTSVKEIKDIINVDTEWSIDFLPEPDNWKGLSLYGFILSVVRGQLHISFYDSEGLIRKFTKDRETETALKALGLIGDKGLVILVRSSFNEQLKDYSVPGVGGRISLGGHSHPKGSGVTPSESRTFDDPADVELFALRSAKLPEGYPIDRDIPEITAREQIALNKNKPVSLDKMLEKTINSLEAFIRTEGEEGSSLPIDELALYLKVLKAMHEETIKKWESSKGNNPYMYIDRAEFAGELAYHPRFQGDAEKILDESIEGAFRVLAGPDDYEMTSIERTRDVMYQVVRELSRHPEFRKKAIALINDPRTYGLNDVTPADGLNKSIVVNVDAQGLASASERLFEIAPRPEDVVGERAVRLFILADGYVNDDLEMAETVLKEYLRIIKIADKYGFSAGVYLERYKNIMNNRYIRPALIEMARSVPDSKNRNQMLTEIAAQFIKEGDIQRSLDLLEEIGSTASYEFSSALGQLADLILVRGKRDKKMIQQLESIIENITIEPSRERYDERKIGLFVKLGNRYYELGMRHKAKGYYEKAWELCDRTAQPIVTRLEYFAPIMREKRLKFPIGREEIIEKATLIGELEISRDRSGRPDILVAVAREHAFNRDYEKAEEVAQYIKDNMRYPRDYYDHCYGAIIEACALYGDNEKIGPAVSKMTNYIKDHFEQAARLLVNKGEYVKAMGLADFSMKQGYFGSSSVGYWGSTQVRIAGDILKRDSTQIEIVKEALGKAILEGGIDARDLEQVIDMIAEHPGLDPDGQFTLRILQSSFERNRSIIAHDGHRVILRKLREIIMARVKNADPSLKGITDVYRDIDRASGKAFSPNGISFRAIEASI